MYQIWLKPFMQIHDDDDRLQKPQGKRIAFAHCTLVNSQLLLLF